MKHEATHTRRIWLAAIFLASAASMWGCAQANNGQGNPPPAAAIVDLCNNTTQGCTTGASFSLQTARDINIKISWINVAPGTHTQTMEVLEPGGGLYEAKSQAFAIAENSDGSATTTEILPVAGTWITERGRSGEWTIRISLDNQPYATQKVQLNP